MTENFSKLFSVQGKTALVTGGSRGIGEMIAAGFLSQGAKVYISSRKADTCQATAQRLSQTYGGPCIALPADLSKLAGVESLAAQPAAHEASLDILVNHAGASWGAPLDQFPEVGWDKVGQSNPSGRVGTAQDIAGLAIFLCSRAGEYVVGQTIACDGGVVGTA